MIFKNQIVTFYVVNNNFFNSQAAFDNTYVYRKNQFFLSSESSSLESSSLESSSLESSLLESSLSDFFFAWIFSRISSSEISSSEWEEISTSLVI